MTHVLIALAAMATMALLASAAVVPEKSAANPIIWADVPDVALLRVGESYYMSSTTMHMSPGLPIMKSTDLVNWSIVNYAYDRLEDNDKLNLSNGQDSYGAGSWASSLRFHNGTFYVTTFSSSTGKTHVYTTDDIEKGTWKEAKFSPAFHDHSLFFDDDGKAYLIFGAGRIKLIELTPDASAVKPGAVEQVIIENASIVAGANVGLRAEGSQIHKINGKYYLFNITWPKGDMRTQIVHRADKITGPYEGRVFLHDKGVAQGCLIDTPAGDWYAMLFQDHGAVGRAPFLVPVKWEDGWPIAVDGKAPLTLNIPVNEQGMSNIVATDEFDRPAELLAALKQSNPAEHDDRREAFPLAWQWNHNPDNRFWSLTQRQGWLRLTSGSVVKDFLQARNSLTQRTFGPKCTGSIKIDVSGMKDGDVAGLAMLQKIYGYVGVKQTGDARSIVMVGVDADHPVEFANVPLTQNTLYLKIDCNFDHLADQAFFYCSLDGTKWIAIGKPLQMRYTLPHFMGYRYALFNFATKQAGGFVDFDYFRPGDQLSP